jgi:serine phosphatase RsbU (regulator of sigma subunit)
MGGKPPSPRLLFRIQGIDHGRLTVVCRGAVHQQEKMNHNRGGVELWQSQILRNNPAALVVDINAARYRFCSVLLRLTPLWREIRLFSNWLERNADLFPEETVLIEITPQATAVVNDSEGAQLPEGCRRLLRFLWQCRCQRLELDRRLESNQIRDLLALLYGYRRSLRLREENSSDGFIRCLCSPAGILFACTHTMILDNTLSVQYTYCKTVFSRLATWFKRLHTNFGDHRTLFWSAPRLGLLFALAPMLVFLLYALHNSWKLLLATSLLGSAALFATTYLFLMIIGSIEYDNECKTFDLQQANSQLLRHSELTHDDLARAREVQQRLLPDIKSMPMADQLEWGASFVPQEQVGGDYFDVASLDDKRIAVLFADVSGHGLAAALVTVLIKAAFQRWVEQDWRIGKLINVLNRQLFELTECSSFAAVVVAIYDAASGELTYSNCGHYPVPYLIHSNGKLRRLDDAGVMILGALEQVETKTATVKVAKGETVVLATDGIIEAADCRGHEFTAEALEDFLCTHHYLSVSRLVGELVSAVAMHSQNASDRDDQAILAFRVRNE